MTVPRSNGSVLSAPLVRRDIFGNAIDWHPTGRRIVDDIGRMRAEMRKDDAISWMYCQPHDECEACEDHRSHDGCPVGQATHRISAAKEKGR